MCWVFGSLAGLTVDTCEAFLSFIRFAWFPKAMLQMLQPFSPRAGVYFDLKPTNWTDYIILGILYCFPELSDMCDELRVL